MATLNAMRWVCRLVIVGSIASLVGCSSVAHGAGLALVEAAVGVGFLVLLLAVIVVVVVAALLGGPERK